MQRTVAKLKIELGTAQADLDKVRHSLAASVSEHKVLQVCTVIMCYLALRLQFLVSSMSWDIDVHLESLVSARHWSAVAILLPSLLSLAAHMVSQALVC